MKDKKVSVAILIPTKGKMHTKTVESLLGLLQYNQSIKLDTGIIFAEGTLLATVRSRLIEEFLKKDYTALMFIDSDMTFAPNMIQKLIDTKKSIVCAVAKVRGGKHWNIFTRDEISGKYMPYKDIDDKLIEIDATGCACILIEKEVVQEILDLKSKSHEIWIDMERGYDKKNLLVNETLTNLQKDNMLFSVIGEKSEDIIFCEYIKSCGYNIYADCSLKLGHINDIVIY